MEEWLICIWGKILYNYECKLRKSYSGDYRYFYCPEIPPCDDNRCLKETCPNRFELLEDCSHELRTKTEKTEAQKT